MYQEITGLSISHKGLVLFVAEVTKEKSRT